MGTPYTGEIVPMEGSATPKPYKGEIVPLSKDEQAEVSKPRLEFPDAPTTGHLELPGMVKLPKWMGGNDDETMSAGQKAATLYGTLSTSNPRARQEIYVQNLKGATAVDDKFGNPMIEYKGKKYYTSRPGEVDAMDVGRFTAAVAGALPAAAVAPASLPMAMLAGGALAGGQSLAEDVVAQASGGKSQDIDLGKAAISAGIGLLAPAAVASIVPVARSLYGRFAGEIFDAAGQPTAKGARVLTEAGITPEQVARMSPAQRQEITQAVNSNFGSSEAARVAQRRSLGTEAGVPQTTGGLLDDPAQLGVEKAVRGGQRGEAPQRLVQEFDDTQRTALTEAQEALRAQAGGGRILNPGEAGEVLSSEFRSLNTAARNRVTAAYRAATNEADVVAAGGVRRVPIDQFQSLPARVNAALDAPGTERLIIDPRNTPNAQEMVDQLGRLSRGDASSIGAPANTAAITWNMYDRLRRGLRENYKAAVRSGNDSDVAAARRVMGALDEHFQGQNPLLDRARQMASDRFETFRPNTRTQTPLTQQVLKFLNKPESAQEGAKVVNDILGNRLASGEALGAIDHLMTIHPPGSDGHRVLAEQALRKIFVNPGTDATLTAQQIATNVNKALGSKQREVYERLLSPELMRQLENMGELAGNIATASRNINPSGSGHTAVAASRKAMEKALGGSAGAYIMNLITQNPVAHAIGGAAGALTGGRVAAAANMGAARGAVAPGANVGGVTAGQIAGAPGLLAGPAAAQQGQPRLQGPVDRLWQGLLGSLQ